MLSPPSAEPLPDAPVRPSPAPPRSEQERADRARMRTLAVALIGLLVGVLGWVVRTHLAGEFRPLVDSAASILIAPFVLGSLMRTRRGAVAAGLASALLALGALAGCSALRGPPLDGSLVLALLAGGLVGGPLLGGAGHLARRGAEAVRGLGAAAAVAVLVAEGAWHDLHLLGAETIGWLSIGCGCALGLLLLRRPQRVRWLALTLPLALAGEIAFTSLHR